MQRDAATEAQIKARISAQMDDEEKKRRADYVIFNDENYSWIRRLQRWKSGLPTEKRADSLCMSFVRCIFVTRNLINH